MNGRTLDHETEAGFAAVDLASEQASFICHDASLFWRQPGGEGWVRWDVYAARRDLIERQADPFWRVQSSTADLANALAEYDREYTQ